MWTPTISSDELYHHGILGMKWGVRRYQNKDGTLTAAGRKHLNMGEKKKGLTDEQKQKIKKVAIGTAVVAGTVLAAYGAYKYSDFIKSSAYNKISAEAALNRAMMNMGGTPSQRGYHMSYYGDKATKLENKAKEVSKSFVKSAKYLKETKEATKEATNVAKEVNKGAEAAKKIISNANKVSGINSTQNAAKLKNAQHVEAVARAKAAQAKRDLDAWKATQKFKDVDFTNGPKYNANASEQKFYKVAEEAAKKKSSSTSSAESALKTASKFMKDNSAKSTGNTNSDLARLLANSQRLSNLANQSYSAATKSTGSSDYAKDLLKKNKSKLSDMTMQDLYDLGF